MNSNKNSALVGVVVLIVAVAFLYAARQDTRTPSGEVPATSSDKESAAQREWETKTDSRDEVDVTVTPRRISADAPAWLFEVTLSTHSVELDQDIVNAAMLSGDGGAASVAVSWEGSPPGGHHRSGILTFDALLPYPREITLKFIGIGDAERIFTWDTSQ